MTGTSAQAPEPGTVCDGSQIMTHEAAVCLARAEGLDQGLEGYAAGIVYSKKELRIVWIVENTTARNSERASGSSMTLDAVTAEVLDRGTWETTN